MKAHYEKVFLDQHKDKSPQQILEHEATRAIATVARIRDEGRIERNVLKACEIIISKALPDKNETTWKGDDGMIYYPFTEQKVEAKTDGNGGNGKHD